MRKKASIENFCRIIIDDILKIRIISYDDFLKYQAGKQIEEDTFELFKEDTFFLRLLSLVICMYEYLNSHNSSIDLNDISGLVIDSTIDSYTSRLLATGTSEDEIESRINDMLVDVVVILQSFQEYMENDNNPSLINRFGSFYSKWIIRKYKVDYSNVNTISTLVDMVLTQLNVISLMVMEWLKHYKLIYKK